MKKSERKKERARARQIVREKKRERERFFFYMNLVDIGKQNRFSREGADKYLVWRGWRSCKYRDLVFYTMVETQPVIQKKKKKEKWIGPKKCGKKSMWILEKVERSHAERCVTGLAF